MTTPAAIHPHERYLALSGLLTAFGLLTSVVFTVRSTPYLMVLFLGLGMTCVVAGVALFIALLVSDVRSRLHSVVERTFQSGETVFRQGDFPDRLYLIGKGEAEVTKDVPGAAPVTLARLGPGEFFGEIGIIGNSPRTATVRAATDLETLSIHRDHFTSLLAYLPAWKERVFDDYRRRAAAPEGRAG
ncbi:MAG: cyclic nucleotide-binding domain-containing protein [Rhodospirillaceae bacterium]